MIYIYQRYYTPVVKRKTKAMILYGENVKLEKLLKGGMENDQRI